MYIHLLFCITGASLSEPHTEEKFGSCFFVLYVHTIAVRCSHNTSTAILHSAQQWNSFNELETNHEPFIATTRMETTHGPTSSMATEMEATAWQQRRRGALTCQGYVCIYILQPDSRVPVLPEATCGPIPCQCLQRMPAKTTRVVSSVHAICTCHMSCRAHDVLDQCATYIYAICNVPARLLQLAWLTVPVSYICVYFVHDIVAWDFATTFYANKMCVPCIYRKWMLRLTA